MPVHRPHPAFTLAELLIALVILGVIATFTIPKVLSSQQDTRFKSIAKEAAGAISGAFTAYKANNTASASIKPTDLLPYLNYVRIETVANIDHTQTQDFLTCDATSPCLMLHNGAALKLDNNNFGGTANTNMIFFWVDPDGKVSGAGGVPDTSATAVGKSVEFGLYYSGRLTTKGTYEPNSYYGGGGPVNPNPSRDPPWFSWN